MNLNDRLARLEARPKRTAGLGWWKRLHEAPSSPDTSNEVEFVSDFMLMREQLDGAVVDDDDMRERRADAMRSYASRNMSMIERIRARIA